MSQRDLFHIEKIYKSTKEENTLFVVAWFEHDDDRDFTLRFLLDGEELSFEIVTRKGLEVERYYLRYGYGVTKNFIYRVSLPGNWKEKSKLQIQTTKNTATEVKKTLSVKQIQQLGLPYYIDAIQWIGGKCYVKGWVKMNSGKEILVKKGENAVPVEMETMDRKDVYHFFEDPDGITGFSIEFVGKRSERYDLCFQEENQEPYRVRIAKESVLSRGMKKLIRWWNKGCMFLTERGLKYTLKLVYSKFAGRNDYQKYCINHKLSKSDLAEQRNHKFAYEPKFSIVIPLYKTPKKYLLEMVDSVLQQTYSNLELCLVDGSGEDSPLSGILKDLQKRDSRVKVKDLGENLGIAENTNAALAMAQGDYIVLADHDDLMALDALYECTKALNENNDIDVIYTDEDKVDMDSKEYFDPNFKPDFNIDYLCSVNYICHLFVFKRELFETLGGFRKEFDGAQDHDLILRYTEKAKVIHHIPKVLYHWRCHINSTSVNPESKLYAFENGAKAVDEHYKRIGIPAHTTQGIVFGLYNTVYEWEERPLVSILVPNKDHIDDLKKCMDSIDEKSTYRNYEWVIVENNSEEEETFAFYEEIKKRDNVKVVTYEGDFNYSRINNFGEQYASGEYVLLLNNDTELITPDGIKDMLDVCMRDDVGIVGVSLFYPDHTVQHAGVVVGFGGIAGHTFIGKPMGDTGYMFRLVATQDYSAVTAACMMVKKSLFDEVGGLTEEFKVAFNDIDFCMKVRKTNHLVVYTPHVKFYHYESKSRGLEDTPEKVERFGREIREFQNRWGEILEKGDPYYNPNLRLDRSDFAIRID